MALVSKKNLDEKWYIIDGVCQRIGERCPQKARDEIAVAATRLAQSEEYDEQQYFLRLAAQALSVARRLIAPLEGESVP